MIFIFAAHYGEVENIIKQKKMGKRKISFPFLQYFSKGLSKAKGESGEGNAECPLSSLPLLLGSPQLQLPHCSVLPLSR